ncbi:MAG: hypothetical protein K0Q62_1225 [Phenylobacterium sp.]|nr:hypothetical protein [Phenylobacterium sp.]
MAKAPVRRLKVFQAQFGFYDSVVAAPSQAAALRAWGVHQNLFAAGRAQITEDGQAVEAALAHPETPLRRAVGSTDPFALEPTGLPKVPDAPRRPAAKPAPKAKAAARPKPPADRSALNAAEAKLRKLDEARKREEADFRRREADFQAAREAAQTRYVEGRKAATAGVVAARTAYRKAGGAD